MDFNIIIKLDREEEGKKWEGEEVHRSGQYTRAYEINWTSQNL